MVFSSMVFLVLFLPVVFGLYLLLPSIRLKNGLLILASLLFYALGEPYYIVLLLLSSFVNYHIALRLEKRSSKAILIVALFFNLGLLFVFKYLGFLVTIINQTGLALPVPTLRLPIGISFYTFQILSYVIDVYRKQVSASRRFGHVLLYISFFPQLIAGPIVKYHDISEQIENRSLAVEDVSKGLRWFIFGLSKKVLLSNTLALVVDQVFRLPSQQLTGVIAWIGAICYTLQIYYDFSGYSDMALGLGKMFGFRFNQNFNYPYAATSMKEFWRRWHISLSSWFKEYLYIPLGGNRISSQRTFLNKMIVFFCTGLWHGANYTFILWGFMNGLLTCLEERGTWVKKIQGKIVGWIYMAFCTIFCFTMFRSESVGQSLFFYKNMLTGVHFSIGELAAIAPYLNMYTIFIMIISCLGIFNWRKIKEKFEALSYLWSLVCLALCIMSLAADGYNPFIYFRF